MPAGTEVETKATPKTAVVANAALALKLKEWGQTDKKQTSTFASACRYAKQHNLSKEVIEASLRQARPGLSDSTFKPEASRIFAFTLKKNEAILEAMEQGKMTVSEARGAIVKKQLNPAEGKKTTEEKLNDKLEGAANFAAKNAKDLLIEVDESDFDREEALSEARDAFVERCGEAWDTAAELHFFRAKAETEATEEEEIEEEKEEEVEA